MSLANIIFSRKATKVEDQSIDELEYNPALDDNHVHTDNDVYGDNE